MKIRRLFLALTILFLAGIGLTIAGDGIKPVYKTTEKAYYLSEAQASFVRPGLQVQIQKVEFNVPNIDVTFRIADNAGQPLDRLGIETPGELSSSFYIARIKPGDTQYTNYRTTIQSSTITGNSTTVAAADAGGAYSAPLGNGVYRYTFGTKLPSDFEVNATHTVAISAYRNLTEFGLKNYISNAVLDFVPSGAPVTQVRDIVRTEACNQCHDPLAVHGSGGRREVRLCILCHQPQSTDADTGNTVDFKVFIHKLHDGVNLPSVKAGKPYQIIRVSGGTNFVYDYSTLAWPQDVRNCTTCHQGASQADNWKNNPSRVACGSCHDDVDFASGKNHVGGVQVDDSKCSICHPADGQEFDLSVSGAHTIPAFSKKLAGVNLKLLEITNTKPGDKPTVSFTLKDNAGNPIKLSDLNSFSLRLAGPVTDYTFNAQEDARSATATSTGYTYTFKTNAIPASAKGTYAVGGEARRAVEITGPLQGQKFEVEEGNTINPIVYFGVGGSKAEPRRTIVDIKNCDTCHKRLSLHGGTRQENPAYCAMCHNPATTDNPNGSRSAGFKVPPGIAPTSINFRFMIHRIHTGEELSRDFTVYRTRGVFNFNEVLFPGDRRNCAKCHVNNSYQLPMAASMANTVAPREFYSPLGPAASACLGCHDGSDAAAHTYLMTAPFGESCAVCHGEGADFAVTKVHAR